VNHPPLATFIHVSELHGAATHLAVVAIPVYAFLLLLRRTGLLGGEGALKLEHWVVGSTIAGVLLAGITGLLVRGQAQTMLRGSSGRLGTWHFWLGIVLTLLVLGSAAWRHRLHGRGRPTANRALLGGGVVALVLVVAQGYMGGRMTYDQGIGVAGGGQFAQTASGAAKLSAALARGVPDVTAGREAFAADGLGCALCHGDHAQGLRGPRLAGGKDLSDFRHVHASGLFPPAAVTPRMFAAINAYLKSLGAPEASASLRTHPRTG
jgi:uncharacterized membrane protein